MVASNWRPDRSREERLARAVQSMIPGTGNGRISVARPIGQAPQGNEVADEEEENEDDNGLKISGSMLPWTDRFVIGTLPGGGVDLRLSWDPWAHHKCATLKGINLAAKLNELGIQPGQVSIHVYWNGVFQPDSRWVCSGTSISISDPDRRIRVGDEFIVKYFFRLDSKATPATPTWKFQVRHTGSSSVASVDGANIPQMGLFGSQVSGFGGSEIYSTVWDNLFFGASQYWEFRKEPGTPAMPTDRALLWEIGSIETDCRVAVNGVVAQSGIGPSLGGGFYERCTIWPLGFRGRSRNRFAGVGYKTDGLTVGGPWISSDGGGVTIPFTEGQAIAVQGAMNAGSSLGIDVTTVDPGASGFDQECCWRDTGSWPAECGTGAGAQHKTGGLHSEAISGSNTAQGSDFSIAAYDLGGDTDWPEEEDGEC